MLFGIGEAGDRAGHSDGFVTEGACVGDDVALRVKVHVARGGARCLLAIVDEEIAFGALRKMHEHESAAADISRDRVHDGEREAGGDRRIDRIAALLQDGDAGVRGVVMHTDHHGVIGGGGGLSWASPRVAARDTRSARERKARQLGGMEGVYSRVATEQQISPLRRCRWRDTAPVEMTNVWTA